MQATLSLAVAAKGHFNPRSFIDALEADKIFTADNVDIHIAHDQPWILNADDLPKNVSLHACPAGTSILKLWGQALACSASDYVAVLDVYCPPAEGWLDSVKAEINKGTIIFCGPVNSGWARNDSRIVGYLAEYCQFNSPLEEMDEVPGNNIVCKSSLLESKHDLQTKGFFKTFMMWKLEAEQSLTPSRINEMATEYKKPFKLLHYTKRRFIHGRCFGATRHDNANQPSRLSCIVFTPVLPVLRTWRIYKAACRHRNLKWAFYRFFFPIILSECAWSAGEFFGYSFGGRRFCAELD